MTSALFPVRAAYDDGAPISLPPLDIVLGSAIGRGTNGEFVDAREDALEWWCCDMCGNVHVNGSESRHVIATSNPYVAML